MSGMEGITQMMQGAAPQWQSAMDGNLTGADAGSLGLPHIQLQKQKEEQLKKLALMGSMGMMGQQQQPQMPMQAPPVMPAQGGNLLGVIPGQGRQPQQINSALLGRYIK